MYAQFSNLSANVPENIKDDAFSILYSITNNKQITIYNFDDKNISYVIPFKKDLNVLNKETDLIFFTQLELHNNDEKMNYISTKTCEGLIYSIINKDDDILKLNTDLFKYNYDMLRLFKKIYSDCGFLFVKTTKKNVEFVFTQDLNTDKLFIPFVSLFELNKLERYLYDAVKPSSERIVNNTPTLLYNAQGELVKMNDSNDSSTIHSRMEPRNFVDIDLRNANKIKLDGIKIGFHGLKSEQISKFEKIIFKDLCDLPVCGCQENNHSEKNFDFLLSIKSEEEFKNKLDDICKVLNEFGKHYNYETFLKFIFKLKKVNNNKKEEEYNKPIKSTFNVSKYLETKYNITKPVDGKLQTLINLFKQTSDEEDFVYFNIENIEMKPEDIILP